MINFWNAVLGFILLVLGVIFIARTIINKKKDFKDVYGNYIGLYTGEVGLIVYGIFLLLRELLKLF